MPHIQVSAFVWCLVVAVPGVPTTALAQQTLTIAGDVGTTLSLAPGDLQSLPRTRVEIKEDGRSSFMRGSWWARS
jgi:hypothetical protein